MIKLLLIIVLSSQLFASDAKLLRLSLEVMLYNNDLENAYKIGKKGLKLYPDDIWWKEKVADISTWLKKSDEAKLLTFQLYEKTDKQKYADKLLNISKATNDKRLELQVLEQQLQLRYDKEIVQKVYTLYDYLGFLKRGSKFFETLYKKHPDKELIKLSILLQSNYAVNKDLLYSLKEYETNYGFDKDVLFTHAKTLYKKRKYKKTYRLLKQQEGKFYPSDKKLWKLYTNVLYILQKDHKLYSVLKASQKAKLLPKNSLNTLITLSQNEDELYSLSLLKQEYNSSFSKNSFYRYLSLLSDIKPKSVKKLFINIPKNLEKELEKDAYFWILKAQNTNTENLMSYYKKALSLKPNSADIHVSYLWQLIEKNDKKALKKELNFIENYFPNLKDAFLPLALGYFNLQQSSKSKNYMVKLLRAKPNDWQVYLFYADVLNLWGNKEGKESYFSKAWIIAQIDKNKNTFTKNKLYDFNRLKEHFAPYQARRKYTQTKQNVRYNSFYLTQNNPRNDMFANSFIEETTSKEPYLKTSISHINRGELKYQQLEASFKHKVKGIDTVFKIREKENFQTDDISMSLKFVKTFKNSTLFLTKGVRKRDEVDIFFKGDFKHRYKRFSTSVSFGLNIEDEITNYMLLYGKKDIFKLQSNYLLTKRDNINIAFKYNRYTDINKTLGSSNGLNLGYKHYTHLAYPDIYYRIFANYEGYTDKYNKLPQDYWQSGLELGVGMLAKDKFSRSFKPYASTNLLYNNQSKLGYSCTLGFGGRVKKRDYLGVELLYADGIGTRMEEYFRIRLSYLFW